MRFLGNKCTIQMIEYCIFEFTGGNSYDLTSLFACVYCTQMVLRIVCCNVCLMMSSKCNVWQLN